MKEGRGGRITGSQYNSISGVRAGAHHQPKKSSLARSCVGHSESKNCTLGFLLLHRCFMVIDWEGKSCALGFA